MTILRMCSIREGNIDITKVIFATPIHPGPSEESQVDFYHYSSLKREQATKKRKKIFHYLMGLT